MTLWQLDSLARRFSEGTVPDREQALYLLALVLAASFTEVPLLFGSQSGDGYVYASSWLAGLGVSTLGTVLCYLAIDHHHPNPGFVARYICLGWLALVRTIAWSLVLALVTVLGFFVLGAVGLIREMTHEDLVRLAQSRYAEIVQVVVLWSIFFLFLCPAMRMSYRRPVTSKVAPGSAA